ncbi:hypothetical protein DPMN_153659 [Dreissena polymorpha]|uniref:Uncharacterized protein n=1 Tax=Dreissena polymorpha TaxID=45954 RepID=A0A9D4FJ06_DREPO|nr:hypothetical protein DPMN_153659 [Dreissena polymorpha]
MSEISLLDHASEIVKGLHFSSKDLGLKTGILELLSVCVKSQPGLIELFLNVQPALQSNTVKVSRGGN